MSTQDSLDAATLVCRAVSRIEDAIREHRPSAIFGLFSGGHDSLTCTHIASLVPGFTAAVHINTGIGVNQTRDFVRETAKCQGWRLLEYKAAENVKADGTPDPQDYRAIVLKHGFPGPGQHFMMYSKLKERQLRRVVRDHKKTRNDRIMFIAGCRNQESERRMRNTKPVDRQGSVIWVNPIHDFSKHDCHSVMAYACLRRSPVVDLIHKSGECLCGSFAKPGELAELKCWFPDTAKEIETLQQEVKAQHGWGWGERPPRKCGLQKGQTEMPLCHNCLIAQP